jgi:hypothetical protein
MRLLLTACMVLVTSTGSAATLDPPNPNLGQRARLRLEVAPADSTEWPVALNAALRATDDPREFELVPLRVGTIAVALPAVGDTLRVEVAGSIEEARPELLRPLHSVGRLGPRWGTTIALASLLLLVVLGVLFWWFRRRAGMTPVPVIPPEPAHLVALRELDRLRRDRLLEGRRFEEFYVRGSHVLREYAGRRFGLPVLDWTTTETLDYLRTAAVAESTVEAIAPLLGAADEVKFARHEPQSGDGEHWLGRAREFVDVTTLAEEPATPEDEGVGPGGITAEVSA